MVTRRATRQVGWRLGMAWKRLRPAVEAARTATLLVGGLGCFTAAAWIWAVPAGLVVAGASLWFIEWAGDEKR